VNSWLPGLLGSLVLGLPATAVAILTYRAASRAQQRSAEVEGRKVDQAAFETAQGIYERGLTEANRQLTRVREELAVEQHETARLRARVRVLERLITANGLSLPNSVE
jgi:hypothetical protein